MHNNYYFFRQLSLQLHQLLPQASLNSAFSQSKGELVLEFLLPNQEFFYMRVNLLSSFTVLSFPEQFNRQKRNSANVFESALGVNVLGVQQYLNERCFSINMENELSLLFKMHGHRSNVVLFNKLEVEEVFRNKLIQDFKLDRSQLDRPIDQSKEAFIASEVTIKLLFPTWGPSIKEIWQQRSAPCTNMDAQWQVLQDLIDELENPKAYYIYKSNQGPKLSLLQTDEPMLSTADQPIAIANEFYRQYAGEYYLEQEKQEIEKLLERNLQRTAHYIKDTQTRLDAVLLSNYEQLGHLIMAYMHQIPAKADKVELPDFHSNLPIEIKLNPDLSPPKNAERYYRKSKNQKVEIERLEENIQAAHVKMSRIEQQLETLKQSIQTVKDLRQFVKEHQLQNVQTEIFEHVPYKEVEFQGFKIWIGKNAAANDELTQRFSHKDDLWLHVRDASGSHVLIKQQSGKSFPKQVIERAAELAAWYSKRKTDSLCPVIVTPKKFVRKPKGLYPGQVRVEKEEVILVKPKGFE